MAGGPMNRETYRLEQLHFHWGPEGEIGSEHRINGIGYEYVN